MKRKYYLSVALWASLLAGCVHSPPSSSFLPTDDPLWQQHLQAVRQIKAYQAKGQLGVWDGQSRHSASFHWQYGDTSHYQLTLSSALNVAQIQLTMTPTGFVLRDSDGNIYYGLKAQQWLKAQLGLAVDWAEWTEWLKGIPPKGQYVVGANHRLHHFVYQSLGQDYVVSYPEYDENLPLPMPREIWLEQGKKRIKIRIKEWQW